MTRRRPSTATLRRLAEALEPALGGRRVDRVWRPSETSLLIRVVGERRRLLVDVDPEMPHAVLTGDWPETPQRPDERTLRLRRELEGARLRAVRAERDRALVVEAARGPDVRRLVVQLAGRYPNVALLASNDDDEGSEHELLRLLDERPGRDPDSPPLPDGPVAPEPSGGRDWLDDHAATAREAARRLALERRRRWLRREARSRDKRLTRKVQAVEGDLERADEAEQYRHWGELLKTVLQRLPRGAEHVDVPDWLRSDGGATRVPLDPTLDAVENMEAHFHRYRKRRRAREPLEERWLELHDALERTRRLVDTLDEVEPRPGDPDAVDRELDAAERELRATGWEPPQRTPPQRGKGRGERRLPYLTYRAADGRSVLVGRSARDNHELTFRVARGRDLWFHARDAPGSHVVLRLDRNDEPSDEAMRDAAHLAARHSEAGRHWRAHAGAVEPGPGEEADATAAGPTVDVTWTERKHVHKPPGAPHGQVHVAGGRTLSIRLDPSRDLRLRRSREG